MTGRLPTPPRTCAFTGCDRERVASGLCFSHYRQKLRGKELTPLRKMRGLKTLPLTIRVDDITKKALEDRVAEGKAKSLYEATRQAIEEGVQVWGVTFPEPEKKSKKKSKKNGKAQPAVKEEAAPVHDAIIKMKDGQEFRGPIWSWKPDEGWFSIPSDPKAPEKILLSEVESAVHVGIRTHKGEVKDVDLMERAAKEGWAP